MPENDVINDATAYQLRVDGTAVQSHQLTMDGTSDVTVDLTVPEEPPPQQPMQTYVLFGPAASHRTAVYLSLANDFLASRRPTFGFRMEDALHAQRVLIVGETEDVSQDMEAALVAAGCQVRRVRGSIAEVTAAFETLTSGPWEP